MTARTLAITLISSVLCGGAAATAEVVERAFEERFAVAAGARLELIHGDGDVTVEPWDESFVEVAVRYRAEVSGVGLSRSPDLEVDSERRGDTIVVRGRETGASIGIYWRRKREYTYSVRAPSWVVLDLHGDDGDVSVSGWRAGLESTLDDGDVSLVDFEAPLAKLELEDGDLEIEGFAGDLVIRVEDGDVDVRDCDSGELRVRSEDGDVSIDRCRANFFVRVDDGNIAIERAHASVVDLKAEDGDVDVELLSADELDLEIDVEDGDVTLSLAPEISAVYSIETRDGRIRLPLGEGIRTEEGGSRASGSFGEGGGRIEIKTADGRVELRSSS